MGDSLTPLMVDRQIQSRCCSLMVWLKLWVRSPPASPKHKQMIIMKEMKYIIEFLSFAVLTLVFLYGFTILIVAV